MKRQRIVRLAALTLLIAVGGLALVYAITPSTIPGTLAQLGLVAPVDAALTASGFIEAEEIEIAPQIGGRIAALYVEEGDSVERGELLCEIDGTLLEARLASARAEVDVARAELAHVEAGARPEQIRQAEAALEQALAARDSAHQAWKDAKAIRDNPQDLEAQIVRARSRVKSAEATLAEAVALKDAAAIAYDNYWDAKDTYEDAKETLRETYKDLPKDQRPSIPADIPAQLDFHMIPYEYWKAWVGVNAAEERVRGAEASLANLLNMRENSQDLDAQIDAARARDERAQAAVRQAEAELAMLRSGPTDEEIAAVSAEAERAKASLETLLVEYGKLTIHAPAAGLVLNRVVREGELAVPGATLLTLGDLDRVTLTVYVPQDKLGKISIGQTVEVQVDSYPGQTFEGNVVAVANEAEFTPRDIQTTEDRVNMVFAVDVSIRNSDRMLKPGVPADATFITQEQDRGTTE